MTRLDDDARRKMHEQNRRSWNAITPVHNAHKRDQSAFFRDGGSTLFPDELELLGDLSGQQLVHLQCNCGQDTLSLAHHAASVTGVDISDAAIAFARELSTQTEIPATFVLDQNYPNPFNPSTRIGYGLPHRSPVQVSVYDARGRLVPRPFVVPALPAPYLPPGECGPRRP